MPKRKDALIIAAVLVIAGALFAVSRLMPKTNLEEKVAQTTMAPDADEVAGFASYMEAYKKLLQIENTAVEVF